MYCPIVSVVSVVYDGLLATVVHLLRDLSSQEYISVPSPSALHVRVVVFLNGMVTSLGCAMIDGGPVNIDGIRSLLEHLFENIQEAKPRKRGLKKVKTKSGHQKMYCRLIKQISYSTGPEPT